MSQNGTKKSQNRGDKRVNIHIRVTVGVSKLKCLLFLNGHNVELDPCVKMEYL